MTSFPEGTVASTTPLVGAQAIPHGIGTDVLLLLVSGAIRCAAYEFKLGLIDT